VRRISPILFNNLSKAQFSLETNLDIEDFNQNNIQRYIIDNLKADQVSVWIEHGEQYCIESVEILDNKDIDY
jgi:hypothetical protein